jgi:hypothetical protein
MVELGSLDQTHIIVAIITGVSGLIISAVLAIKEIYFSFLLRLSYQYNMTPN